jgi:hypothetical protein
MYINNIDKIDKKYKMNEKKEDNYKLEIMNLEE